jgi:hypothetical protein
MNIPIPKFVARFIFKKFVPNMSDDIFDMIFDKASSIANQSNSLQSFILNASKQGVNNDVLGEVKNIFFSSPSLKQTTNRFMNDDQINSLFNKVSQVNKAQPEDNSLNALF